MGDTMDAIILTDEQKIEDIKEKTNELSKSFTDFISSLHSCNIYNGDIPNVGICYGNKLIEIYRYYKKRKVPYVNSDITAAIEYYLCFAYLNPATTLITSYMITNATYKAAIKRVLGIQTNYRNMLLYKDYCDELFKFDIEKDVDRAIRFHLEAYMASDAYAGDIDEILARVNNELQKLGIDKKISMAKQKKINMG